MEKRSVRTFDQYSSLFDLNISCCLWPKGLSRSWPEVISLWSRLKHGQNPCPSHTPHYQIWFHPRREIIFRNVRRVHRFILCLRQNRESTEGYSMSIVRKNNDKFGKGSVSTSRTYASLKGTGPGVWWSKSPLSACHTRRKCSMETTQNSVKCRVRYKVWSLWGSHCIWSGHRMSFNICERETLYCLIRSPYRP